MELTEIDTLRSIHAGAKAVAQRLRLPFRTHAWKGTAGNWQGVGIGSSIDFQDHRPYLPGDDPRYIDWQVYARSGNYTMKLYREEVSARVDLVLDVSASMSLTAAKRVRTLELLYFVVESGLLGHASIRCTALHDDRAEPIPVETLLGHGWVLPEDRAASATAKPRMERVALRHGSMRVFISDVLYPGPPEPVLRLLRSHRGRGVILSPFLEEEVSPPWDGNVELTDCEQGALRKQRVMPEIHRRYCDAYRRHIELWADQSRRHDVVFSRVPCDGVLIDSLQQDALHSGAVEMWS